MSQQSVRPAPVRSRAEIAGVAREHLRRAFPDVLAIYLFGSFAGDEPWPASDVDLGLLLADGRRAEPEPLLDAAATLGRRFLRNVDLVDLRAAGVDLPKEVLQKGRALFIGDPDAVLTWEATVLSDYGRLNLERREIMEDFRRTGIAYRA